MSLHNLSHISPIPNNHLALFGRRACRGSELREPLISRVSNWVKGIKLRRPHHLVLASLLVGGLLFLHYYQYSHFYVLRLDGHETGLVREAEAVERFVDDLMEKCGALYGMQVAPQQEITLTRELRLGCEADWFQAEKALRQQISLVTEARMVSIEGKPLVPVATERELAKVVELLGLAYINREQNARLLEVELVEDVQCKNCKVPPVQVFSAEEVASLLLPQGQSPEAETAARSLLASRSGRNKVEDAAWETAEIPAVHVKTVEEATREERIPFATTYTNNSNMWVGQSRVVTPGEEGLKQVTYRITRENGKEIAREAVSEQLLKNPVNRVVERGTARRFIWPVAGGGRISQYFKGSAHRGIDIAAPTGTPVLAADSGTVVRSAWGASQGNYIILYHGDYWTLYLHHSVNLVSVGQKVTRGQMIARVGSTGNSTGPHLHFEIRRGTGSSSWPGWYYYTALNPLSFY